MAYNILPKTITKWLNQNNESYGIAYTVLLCILVLYFSISIAIIGNDTDMWYHMSMGKYIVDSGEIPTSTFFSYINHEQIKTNIVYYWLFDLFVYTIYFISGTWGLIAVRTAIMLLTMFLVFRFITGQEHYKNNINKFIIIFTIFSLMLVLRGVIVRPHLFDYLFILLFIFIIEFHPKKVLLLPFIGVIWCNIHGIEYPVMVLITLSYIIEIFFKRIRRGSGFTKEELYILISLVVTTWTVLATPYGFNLIKLPFEATEYTSMYIGEVMPLNISDIFSYSVSWNYINPATINNLAVTVVFIGFIGAAIKKQLRISHLLMFAGGCILVIKGVRFVNEFVLLGLPVVAATFFNKNSVFNKTSFVPIIASVMIFFTIVYLNTCNNMFMGKKFAINQSLPTGITEFLKNNGPGGKIMAPPGVSGYLIWHLYPNHKIFMNLVLTCFFDDRDYFVINSAYSNFEAFNKFIKQYNPSFVIVSIDNNRSTQIVENHKKFKPVFFDNAYILYVDSSRHPDLAEQYELKIIKPFEFIKKLASHDDKININSYLNELVKLNALDPSVVSVNHGLALIYNTKDDYKKAIPHGTALINSFSNSSIGHMLVGISMYGLKNYGEALNHFKSVLSKSNNDEINSKAYIYLCRIYLKLNDIDRAYDAMKKGTDIFSHKTSYEDLYYLGYLSYLVGNTEEAAMLFEFAYIKVPPEQGDWKNKIRQWMNKVSL